MNKILDQKRLIILVLSFLMVLSLASMTAGTALRSDKVDTQHLLEHAIKVDKNYLRNRGLEEVEEDQDQDKEQDQEQNQDQEQDNEDGNGDEDDGEDQANEDENNDVEEEDAENDDADADEDQEDNNEEDVEEEAYEDDAVDEEEDNAEEEAYEDDAVDGEEDDAVESEEEEAYEDDAVEEEEDDEVEEEVEEDDAVEEDEEEEDESESSSEDQEPQIDFLSCIAMTIEPNIVDVGELLESGEINEDEAADMKMMYVTEITPNLYTQESVVFFTYGYGQEDDDRELYMVSINDWIEASTGYDQTCEVVAEGLESSVEEYSNHVWYEGFNCMNDGTGFKSQLFLDETCNTFSPNLTEEDVAKANSELGTYLTETTNDYIQNSQICEENEFCDEIFRNSVQPTTCEEGEDKKRKLMSYQLENEMASNIEDACPSIQTYLNIDEEHEYQIDEIEELVLQWSNTKNGGQKSDRRSIIPGLSDTWLYITVGLLVILYIGTLSCRTEKPMIKKSSSDDTDDTKKEPLVKNRMAQAEEIQQNFSSIECTLSKKKLRKLESVSSEKRGRRTTQFREFLRKSLAKDTKSTDSSTSRGVGNNSVANNSVANNSVANYTV